MVDAAAKIRANKSQKLKLEATPLACPLAPALRTKIDAIFVNCMKKVCFQNKYALDFVSYYPNAHKIEACRLFRERRRLWIDNMNIDLYSQSADRFI